MAVLFALASPLPHYSHHLLLLPLRRTTRWSLRCLHSRLSLANHCPSNCLDLLLFLSQEVIRLIRVRFRLLPHLSHYLDSRLELLLCWCLLLLSLWLPLPLHLRWLLSLLPHSVFSSLICWLRLSSLYLRWLRQYLQNHHPCLRSPSRLNVSRYYLRYFWPVYWVLILLQQYGTRYNCHSLGSPSWLLHPLSLKHWINRRIPHNALSLISGWNLLSSPACLSSLQLHHTLSK